MVTRLRGKRFKGGRKLLEIRKNLMLVVPAHNEFECIQELIERIDFISRELKARNIHLTLFLIDDASTDQTWSVVSEIGSKSFDIFAKQLPIDVGHQQALWEGLIEFSDEFDALVFMDADLQDPPETILDFVNTWLTKSCDLVVGVRENRKSDNVLKRTTANLFYRFMNIFSNKEQGLKIKNAGDFRLIDKSIVKSLLGVANLSGLTPLRFLTLSISKKVEFVYYIRPKRYAGSSKYGPRAMLSLAFQSIRRGGQLTHRVLQLFSLISGLSSVGLLLIISIQKFALGKQTLSGWFSLVLLLLLSVFVQSTMLLLLSFELKNIQNSIVIPRSNISNSVKLNRLHFNAK
jgi:glycosyltransferase involved in cell wall biosynthesis